MRLTFLSQNMYLTPRSLLYRCGVWRQLFRRTIVTSGMTHGDQDLRHTSRTRLFVRSLLTVLAIFCASFAGAAPRNIQTGAFVTSVSGVDLADGSFRIHALLWFIDPAGDFDPVRDVHVIARQATVAQIEQFTRPDGAIYTSVQLEATIDQLGVVAELWLSRIHSRNPCG